MLLPTSHPARATRSENGVEDESVAAARTVLVVDDEATVRRVAARMLQGEGYRVLDADSGDAALEIFREQKEEIAVEILDATMPGMDGAATFHGLRSIRSDLPIVFVSGHSEQDVTQSVSGEKGLRFLKKPFTIASLNTTVREVLIEQKA